MTVVRWIPKRSASSLIVAPATRCARSSSTCGGVRRVCLCGSWLRLFVVRSPLSALFGEAATL